MTPSQMEAAPMTAQKTLAFFRSVIMSGEAWTDACAQAYADAAFEITATAEAARKMREALETLMRLRNAIEVMGEWSANNINRTPYKRDAARVDAAMANGRAALSAASAAGIGDGK